MNPYWEDDLVQFARLLCEINATQEIDIISLCESMDLNHDEVIEVWDRADKVWESVKASVTQKYIGGATVH
jgi:hypothetical protein